MCLCVRVDEEIGRRWKVVAVAAVQRSPSKSRRQQSCTTHTDTTGLPPPPSKNSSRESNPIVVVRARGGVDRRRRRSSGKTHRSGEIHTAAVRGRTRVAYLYGFFFFLSPNDWLLCCKFSVCDRYYSVSSTILFVPSKLPSN